PLRPWIRLLGAFDDHIEPTPAIRDWPRPGTIDSLIELGRQVRLDDIFLAPAQTSETAVRQALDKLRVLPVNVHLSTESDHTSTASSSIARHDQVLRAVR